MKKSIFLAVGLFAGMVVWQLFGPSKTFRITPYAPGDPGLFSIALICPDKVDLVKPWYEGNEETKEGGLFDTYHDDGEGRKVRYGGSYSFPEVTKRKIPGQGVTLKVDEAKRDNCRLYFITRDPSGN